MLILIFILGLIMGSFLNVCIYRIPKNKSLFWPRSFCPRCESPISFYDNIPILSYIMLQGKCRKCNQAIPIRYPIVEFLSGTITVLTYLKFNLSSELAFYLLLSYALIVIAFIDIDTQLIHNKVLLFVLVAGVFLNSIFKVILWTEALIGFTVTGGLMFLLALAGKYVFKKESMGMGDVKFAAVAGFFLGWKISLLGLYFGFVLALFIYIGLKAFKFVPINKYIPMGPWLSLSLFIFILWGENLINFYQQIIH